MSKGSVQEVSFLHTECGMKTGLLGNFVFRIDIKKQWPTFESSELGLEYRFSSTITCLNYSNHASFILNTSVLFFVSTFLK